MRKLLLFVIAILTTGMAMAIPAFPGRVQTMQPDGSLLYIRVYGDEYLNYTTTDDGYSIVKRGDGFFVYAQLTSDGLQLEVTDQVAHNADSRNDAEKAWLAGMTKHLKPAISPETGNEQRAEQQRRMEARKATAAKAALYDYSTFKGLIVLVQYNDREFSRPNYDSIVYDMANKEGYTGYSNSQYGRFTGSVRDYYSDNSNGIFQPTFDVVGPVTVDLSQYFPEGTKKAAELMYAAVNAVDSLVDFSQYDMNHDGTVDMVYFIFAGEGSNYGLDSRLLWPHAGSIYNPNAQWGNWEVKKDGVSLGRYACSIEMYGAASSNILEGIGVICHEFSHVLGLEDLYDTNYEEGGQSAHPGNWSIMAGGGYNNYGRTPTGYTLYERYSLGFTTPQLIDHEGTYTLPAIGESNMGYKMTTPVKKEYFLVENRQNTSKWDQYLPGHGMLVFRVDSTSTSVWTNNKVNCNPNHNYFELIRAGGYKGDTASPSDPFPGTFHVTELSYATQPANLLTWGKKKTLFGLENITEENGVIQFDIINMDILKSVTLPEQITMGKGMNTLVQHVLYPRTAICELTWTSSNTDIVTVDSEGLATGMGTGEADITLTAAGIDTLVATCHVTVMELDGAQSIADFRAQEAGHDAVLTLNNALVVYTNGTDAYVRDESGSIVFNNTGLELKAGYALNGSVYGKLNIVKDMPQLQGVEGMTNSYSYTVTTDNEVTPRQVTASEICEQHYGDLITLKTVELELTTKTNPRGAGIWAVTGDNYIRLYNTFQEKGIIVPPKIDGLYFDVTGIYKTNTLNGKQINEIALLKSPVETAPPSAINMAETGSSVDDHTQAVIYNADGRMVARTSVGLLRQLPLRHGIYVVKAGNKTWRLAK